MLVFEVYFSGFRILRWQFLFFHSKDVILLSFALRYFWCEVRRSHSDHCSPICNVYFSLAAFTIFYLCFSAVWYDVNCKFIWNYKFITFIKMRRFSHYFIKKLILSHSLFAFQDSTCIYAKPFHIAPQFTKLVKFF